MLVTALGVSAAAGALITWLAGRGRVSAQVAALREERGRLLAQLEAERGATAEKLALVQRAEGALRDAFASLSAEALRRNNQSFLDLAGARMGELERSAATQLDQRHKAVDALVAPIRDALARVDGKLREVEKE
ncbi:MAG TPA: hypothetical protein VEB59_16925, partial [Gemmatimonadales bacterium]|nr:hypothetical protein [Gemmatimonadales bacterium]